MTKLHAVLLALLLPASALATTAQPLPEGSQGVHLSQSMSGRKASLLAGLELDATYRPSAAPALRLLDGVRFDREGVPSPLDQGGGVDSGTRQILALLLGLLVGFGTGHLIAQDRNGFVLWLIVDIAIILATAGLGYFVAPFGLIGGIALILSHVFQGLDAYGRAGGEKIIQRTREKEIRVASSGSGLFPAVSTSRLFALSF
jgi:hypothetical protein